MPHRAILNVLSSLPSIPPREAEEIARLFVPKTVKKKEILLEKDQVSEEVFFVVKGLLRNFIIGATGREVTTNFSTEYSFAMEPGSFRREIPAVYSIQAVEDSLLLSLSRKDLYYVFDNIPSGDRVGRLLTEIQLEHLGRKHLLLRNFTAEERFDNFTVFYPNVLERAPSYMVASFLGVSRATLHRLQIKHLRK